MEKIRESATNITYLQDPEEREKAIQQLISSAKKYADSISEAGDFFEAGDLLQSTAEILEEHDFEEAVDVYIHTIKLWKSLIDNLVIQARLHEIAEIYLKIADIYGLKLQNYKSEKEHILKSIKYLVDESDILQQFGDYRKLAQNFENIAELYFKIGDFGRAITFYYKVIEISKANDFLDLLSFSYRQIAKGHEELDDYNSAKEAILEGIDYFEGLFLRAEEKNDNLAVSQLAQILKNLYKVIKDTTQFTYYTKKEAGAYINLAEHLEKKDKNFQKIARYYRGAGLCYKEIHNNLIECASCFVLAGNYSKDPNEAAINYLSAANIFKDLKNFEMAYKNFIKAGDNFWNIGDAYQSTESFLNAYDLAIEVNLEFNRYGIFNQIVRGLNKVAKEGLQNKEFFTAASLILESIKFYEQLDISKDFLLKEMVRNVYKYYYRAASLKKIGYSHVVQSYIMASLSCILIGKLDKAWEIISEVDSDAKTVNDYREIVKIIIDWVSEGKNVDINNFPYNLKHLIENSNEIKYLLNLFKRL
mgnify:CR=1 FL=1